MNNLALSEATPVNHSVYNLEGYDPEGGNVWFGLIGSENFDVNPKTGEVKVIKALDREVCIACISFPHFFFSIFFFQYRQFSNTIFLGQRIFRAKPNSQLFQSISHQFYLNQQNNNYNIE